MSRCVSARIPGRIATAIRDQDARIPGLLSPPCSSRIGPRTAVSTRFGAAPPFVDGAQLEKSPMLLPMRPRLGAAATILETVTVEPAGSDILVSRSAACGGSDTSARVRASRRLEWSRGQANRRSFAPRFFTPGDGWPAGGVACWTVEETRCSARAVLLGGASRFCGTHLVIPDGPELDVVTVLSDSQLALGAGAHHALLQ
jgi:hypothetical protein